MNGDRLKPSGAGLRIPADVLDANERQEMLVRIRSIRPFVALLVVAVVCAGGVLTGCGSSKTSSTQTTQTTSGSSSGSSQNADGCPTGTSIPQGGGDKDGDNSGGSSDRDGCL
jgi:hypothetical protein